MVRPREQRKEKNTTAAEGYFTACGPASIAQGVGMGRPTPGLVS
ncbi:hypothetical protein [Paenibacillus sp. J23TS9]|nr:hypothetical protein [Paenibacillus sp. J23TS9]